MWEEVKDKLGANGLSLSGGLDSRAILSAVDGHAPSLATYTLGIKGCADEVIAAKLAQLTGTQHRFFELDDKYLKDFLPNLTRLVSLTDGMGGLVLGATNATGTLSVTSTDGAITQVTPYA